MNDHKRFEYSDNHKLKSFQIVDNTASSSYSHAPLETNMNNRDKSNTSKLQKLKKRLSSHFECFSLSNNEASLSSEINDNNQV